MSTQTLTIKVDIDGSGTVTGSRVVGRSLGDVQKEATSASRALSGARGSLVGFFSVVGAVQLTRQLASIADEYTNIGARLKLASGGTVAFAQAQAAALGVAQRTSASLSSTADLIGKLSTSFRSLGADSNTAFKASVQLTETINKAIALSGASAQTANDAIIQLGQGLASGTLRGDELNSVLEGTPRLAQAIAEGMGKTVGQLRALGAQGKITAKQIVEALHNQAGELDKEYAQLPLTIGRAWTQLQNQVISYIGTADQANGVSRKVANGIADIATHLDDIVRAVVTLGEIVATVYATKLIASGLAWMANLRAQELAVIENATVTQVSAVRAAKAVDAVTLSTTSNYVAQSGMFVQMKNGLSSSVAQVGKLGTVLRGVIGVFKVLAAAVIGWQIGTWLRDQFFGVRVAMDYVVRYSLEAIEQIKHGWQKDWLLLKIGFDAFITAVKTGIAGVVNMWAGVLEGLSHVALVGGDKYAASAAQMRSWSAALTANTGDVDANKKALEKLDAEHAATMKQIHDNTQGMIDWDAAGNHAATTTNTVTDAIKEVNQQLANSGSAATKASKKISDYARALQSAADMNQSLADHIADLRDQIAGMTDAQIEFRHGIEDANRAYEELIRTGTSAANANLWFAQTVAQLHDQFDLSTQAADQNAAATKRLGKTQDDNAARANAYYQTIRQGAQSIADVIAGTLVGTVNSAKSLWGQLVDIAKQVVAQIISTWLQLRVIGPILNGLFGGYGGGGGGLVSSLAGTAANYMVGGGSGGGGSAGYLQSAGSLYKGYSWLSGAKNAYTVFASDFSGMAGSTIIGNTAYSGTIAGSGVGGFNTGLGGQTLYIDSAGNIVGSATPYTPLGGVAHLGGYSVPFASIGGGLIGAYYGSQRGDGGIGTVGSTAAYGALGAGIAGTAAGVAGGASLGAAAGGAFGVAGSASWIPVVGWIAALAAVVDYATGGKIFGSKYKTDQSKVDLAISSAGATASGTIHDWKYVSQGSQFLHRIFSGGALLPSDWGDKKYKTKAITVTPEMQAAAQSLFDNVQKTMVQGAQKLGITVPAMIDATLSAQSSYDKHGKLKSTDYVVEYLGRTFKEATAEAAAKRIGAEALVATVAASAGQTAQTLAEQWRGSADTLLDGAQMMLLAQADINKGNNLLALGAGETLSSVTKLVQQMQADGESLAATYQRLSQANQAYLDFVDQFTKAVQGAGLGVVLADINNAMKSDIDKANALAQAAGLQGAREEDLANIHQAAAQQAADAIRKLASAADMLAAKLYNVTGHSIEVLNAQIDALMNKLGPALQLALGSTSIYKDTDKLGMALQGLQSGLVTPDAVLQIGQRLYGGASSAYRSLYAQVSQIAGLPGNAVDLGNGLNQLGALTTQRNQMVAVANAAQRVSDAKTLASYVADLSTVRGDSVSDVATSLGFNLSDLAHDLGVTDIDAYLADLQKEDIPGALGAASDEIINAIRGIGHDIVAAITGGDLVNPPALPPPVTMPVTTPVPVTPGLPGVGAGGVGVGGGAIGGGVGGAILNRLDQINNEMRRQRLNNELMGMPR